MSPSANDPERSDIRHINPEGLYTNPHFTQVVSVSGPVRTVRVAGQVSVDAGGAVVGKGDMAAQAAQVFANIRTALAAAGADLGHVIGWTFYLAAGENPGPVLQAYQTAWNGRPNPPMVNLLHVAALANPDLLLEIETVAVVPLR